MSRGLGRVERLILDGLNDLREPLLADRWHPLLVEPMHDGPRPLLSPGGIVGQTLIGAIIDRIPHLGFAGRMEDDEWEAIAAAATVALESAHRGPHRGMHLTGTCE